VGNFRKHSSKQIRNLVRSLIEYVYAHPPESTLCACSSLVFSVLMCLVWMAEVGSILLMSILLAAEMLL
jgi:hypothetical protein